VDADTALLADVAELSKAIHEEADAGPGSANHFCKGFLSYWRNQHLRTRRITVVRHQQEGSREAPFALVE
jgi:hypothetical protein